MYLIRQVLLLLQACPSKCFDPTDPKTVIIRNYQNSSVPPLDPLKRDDIAMCMIACYTFTLCRSVDWLGEETTCQLKANFGVYANSLMTKDLFVYVDRETFPKSLAGNCTNHPCTDNSICIHGSCVPLIKEKRYKDCSEILKTDTSKKEEDGVYVIYTDTLKEVYCDMTTDGGGWTVIQKREDGDVDFYRTWNEFKEGFGNASKNYWIGNDAIHVLTKDQNQELRVDLQAFNGEKAYAEYSTFYIGNEATKYKLTVSGYTGTAGDSLTFHNGMGFTTLDQDNDINRIRNCAIKYHGAWWHRDCYRSHLNGQYFTSPVVNGNAPLWFSWKFYEALQKTRMMIRIKN